MLTASHIAKHYATGAGPLTVLRDISLTLAPAAAAVIQGPSGCGKSTLLNIIGTLEPPDAGQVTLDGRDPFTLPPHELARFRNRHVGFIFQDHHLLPQCSVLENVLLPTIATPPTEDATPRAHELLERVGLANRRDHRPAELSGGERQRVAIARALINRPRLVLADEPTGNLDQHHADQVGNLLAELHRAGDLILLVVTHSSALAARFERRFELRDGALTTG